ncbi:MAG: hypothetical protein RBS19_02795 [Bacteroidales bacterium]|nr:hypothetical protein [Bacteroidales bacterium]
MKNLNKILILSVITMLVNFTAFAQSNQTMLSEYWSGQVGKFKHLYFLL